MSIIISKNGKDARKVKQKPVEAEDYLQQYIYDNPDSLPFDTIKGDTKLLVLGKEFSTDSGPIDVLAVDGVGDLYIVETKLYKNPDKRRVIGQMLDYGAALWKGYGNGDEFLTEIDRLLAGGLNKKLSALYGLSDPEVEDVRNAIKQNLADGNIKFVVLMDRLDDRLRDLILFINQKSRFNIYAVEMEFYEHEGIEIVIPKLFGAEVKKELSASGGGRRKRIGSEDEFFAAVENESAKPIFKSLLKLGDDLGADRYFGSSGISVKLPDPKGTKQWVTLFVINVYGEFYTGWTIQQLDSLNLPTKWGTDYVKAVAALVPGVQPDSKNPDSLSRTITADEINRSFEKFAVAVANFAQQIRKA